MEPSLAARSTDGSMCDVVLHGFASATSHGAPARGSRGSSSNCVCFPRPGPVTFVPIRLMRAPSRSGSHELQRGPHRRQTVPSIAGKASAAATPACHGVCSRPGDCRREKDFHAKVWLLEWTADNSRPRSCSNSRPVQRANHVGSVFVRLQSVLLVGRHTPPMPWNSHSMKVHSGWLKYGTTRSLGAFFSCCSPLSPCTKDEAITAKVSVNKGFCTVQAEQECGVLTQSHFQPIGSTATGKHVSVHNNRRMRAETDEAARWVARRSFADMRQSDWWTMTITIINHSFSQLFVHKALTCPEGQSARAVASPWLARETRSVQRTS